MLNLLGSGVDLLLALLATTAKTEHKVKSGLLLDIVVGEGTAILKLLAGKNETLLVWWNAFLVYYMSVSFDSWITEAGRRTLNFGLYVVDGVGRLYLKGDGLARKGLYENLHGDLNKSW